MELQGTKPFEEEKKPLKPSFHPPLRAEFYAKSWPFQSGKIQVLPANRLLELSSIDSPFTWMSQEVSKWLVSGL